jgi:hypothetical protein
MGGSSYLAAPSSRFLKLCKSHGRSLGRHNNRRTFRIRRCRKGAPWKIGLSGAIFNRGEGTP